MKSNSLIIIFVLMFLFFLVVWGFLIWGIVEYTSNLQACQNEQSVFCPIWTCPTVSTATQCSNYAYRTDDEGNTICNFPPTLQPFSSTS